MRNSMHEIVQAAVSAVVTGRGMIANRCFPSDQIPLYWREFLPPGPPVPWTEDDRWDCYAVCEANKSFLERISPEKASELQVDRRFCALYSIACPHGACSDDLRFGVGSHLRGLCVVLNGACLDDCQVFNTSDECGFSSTRLGIAVRIGRCIPPKADPILSLVR